MGEKTTGVDIVAHELRIIREIEGLAAALRTAEEMIAAASSIIARERGPDAALRILTQVAQALPDRRERAVH